MNPAELRLLQNAQIAVERVNAKAKEVSDKIEGLERSVLEYGRTMGENVTTVTDAITSLTKNFTPFIAKVVLPDHMRGPTGPVVEDIVDGERVQTQRCAFYPVEDGEEVLVLGGILNKKGMVIAVSAQGRVLWPLPATLFEPLP
jgi:hypothetical protein